MNNFERHIFLTKVRFSFVMTLVFAFLIGGSLWLGRMNLDSGSVAAIARAAPLLPATGGAANNFSVLPEAGSPEESSDAKWWLNSGALVWKNANSGHTQFGELATSSIWRLRYAESNPIDTDNGFHPQNIFRYLSREKMLDQVAEGYFRIEKYHLSPSPQREQSNGVLLISRYQDGDDLYYAGLRVDGYAVIKKKYQGVYHTLALVPVYADNVYDRETVPNLLPVDKWFGLRMVTFNNAKGGVNISLLLDRTGKGNWDLIADAWDNGAETPALDQAGRSGIRTDFMDVEFERYRVSSMWP